MRKSKQWKRWFLENCVTVRTTRWTWVPRLTADAYCGQELIHYQGPFLPIPEAWAKPPTQPKITPEEIAAAVAMLDGMPVPQDLLLYDAETDTII